MQDICGKVAVIGVGYSPATRHPKRIVGLDALDACRRAIADAGLKLSDIDGLVSTNDSSPARNMVRQDGVSSVSPEYIAEGLGLEEVQWAHNSGRGFFDALNAVNAGVCKYALVWRAVSLPQGQRYGAVDPEEASGLNEFCYPYGYQTSSGGSAGPPSRAVVYKRYMEKYGATREHMATFIVNNRKMALLNERGFWRNERPDPLSREDYLSSRMIADPFCLYDCDVPVQISLVWIIAKADRAAAAPQHPAYIVGYQNGPMDFHQQGKLEGYQEAQGWLGKNLWKKTGLSPKDVSVAQMYDGFSMFVYLWAEGMGLCKQGEAFQFVQDGRIALGGQLPLCTGGGSLGEGRSTGGAQLTEAIMQAAGRAGPRQVKNANLSLACWAAAESAVIFSHEPLK